MIDRWCIGQKWGISTIFKWIKFQRDFHKEHPDYFHPDNTIVYTGGQGTGKTLSATIYVYNLLKKYPKAKLVTNIDLRDYPTVTFEEFISKNIDRFPEGIDLSEVYKVKHDTCNRELIRVYRETYKKYMYDLYYKENRVFPFYNEDDFFRYTSDEHNNGEYGIIYFVDELPVYLNCLASKNINPAVSGLLAMQRKRRMAIVGTSQRIGRTCKQLREQYPTIVDCKSYLGGLVQVNSYCIDANIGDDGHIDSEVSARTVFVRDPFYFGSYDTYRIIKNADFKTGDVDVLELLKEVYNGDK